MRLWDWRWASWRIKRHLRASPLPFLSAPETRSTSHICIPNTDSSRSYSTGRSISVVCGSLNGSLHNNNHLFMFMRVGPLVGCFTG